VTSGTTTNTASLRIVEGSDAARAEVIARQPFGEIELPEALQASIAELWGEPLGAAEHVARIVADVAKEGDSAVARYSQRFDGSSYETIEVTQDEISAAFATVPQEQIDAVEFAANRVRQYHREQMRHAPQSFHTRGTGMIVRPLQKVGIYMTGSDAALPSSVIHTTVPGVVAGVDEVIGVTAAQADGRVNPLKLVAAKLSGVQRIFRASGAQAIAALAFGTETIPRVDKIYGPGNIFVTLAKQQLYGRVGIDAVYGPTETLVIADDSARIDLVAADLLAQAEHDRLATSVLITNSRKLAEAVAVEIEVHLATLERGEIARAAIERGGAVVVATLDEAVELADEFAPEHLCILVRKPDELLPKIRHAGGIFVGESSPEVLGDYTAGPSHVMPTGGAARFASPLSVLDFLKITSMVRFDEHELERQGPYAALLARAEGLTAHASSIERRIEGK
jgi:histidinol dehydrogenase